MYEYQAGYKTDKRQPKLALRPFVHLSEDVFMCADDFAPERWLGLDAANLNLHQFLVAFLGRTTEL